MNGINIAFIATYLQGRGSRHFRNVNKVGGSAFALLTRSPADPELRRLLFDYDARKATEREEEILEQIGR